VVDRRTDAQEVVALLLADLGEERVAMLLDDDPAGRRGVTEQLRTAYKHLTLTIPFEDLTFERDRPQVRADGGRVENEAWDRYHRLRRLWALLAGAGAIGLAALTLQLAWMPVDPIVGVPLATVLIAAASASFYAALRLFGGNSR
jgi:hypothetical protein